MKTIFFLFFVIGLVLCCKDIQTAVVSADKTCVERLLFQDPSLVNTYFDHSLAKTEPGKYKFRKVETVFQAAATGLRLSPRIKKKWIRPELDDITQLMLDMGKVDLDIAVNGDNMNIMHIVTDVRLKIPFYMLLKYMNETLTRTEIDQVLNTQSTTVGTPMLYLIMKDRGRGNRTVTRMVHEMNLAGATEEAAVQADLVKLNKAMVNFMRNDQFEGFRILYEEYFMDVNDMFGFEPDLLRKEYPIYATFLCVYDELAYCPPKK